MTDEFERLKRNVESKIDLGAIREEYKSMLAKEFAKDVRERARKEAEGDIRKLSAEETGISR
jgi:hypothetical protein